MYTKISNEKGVKGHELILILLASIQKYPSTYEEAINSEKRKMWIQAIKEELEKLKMGF